jgi:hypothetical protein
MRPSECHKTNTSLQRFVNGKVPSPSIAFAELPREEPERSKNSAGTSAAQSRRAKNAAHRADDVGTCAHGHFAHNES